MHVVDPREHNLGARGSPDHSWEEGSSGPFRGCDDRTYVQHDNTFISGRWISGACSNNCHRCGVTFEIDGRRYLFPTAADLRGCYLEGTRGPFLPGNRFVIREPNARLSVRLALNSMYFATGGHLPDDRGCELALHRLAKHGLLNREWFDILQRGLEVKLDKHNGLFWFTVARAWPLLKNDGRYVSAPTSPTPRDPSRPERQGDRWSTEEDNDLRTAVSRRTPMLHLTARHRRSQTAISARVRLLFGDHSVESAHYAEQ